MTNTPDTPAPIQESEIFTEIDTTLVAIYISMPDSKTQFLGVRLTPDQAHQLALELDTLANALEEPGVRV